MRKRIGIIGLGNMGRALLSGLTKSNTIHPQEVLIIARKEATLSKALEEFGVEGTLDLARAAEDCEIVFLCVKSTQAVEVIKDFGQRDSRGKNLILVSMCAGVPLAALKEHVATESTLIKAIANLNIQTADGFTVLFSPDIRDIKSGEIVKNLFAKLGYVVEAVTEGECDTISNVSATIPAFIALTISALLDAGIYCGVPKDLSYTIATQVMAGTARSMLSLGVHPEVFRQMVTSPGGVVIKGVSVLESNKIRSAFIEAVATVDRLVANKVSDYTER